MTLSDSYNYFFSSTPQVLGGILALFGVFVIFAVQTIRTELLNTANIITRNINGMTDGSLTGHTNGEINGNPYKIRIDLGKAIEEGSLNKIKKSLELIKNNEYSGFCNAYLKGFDFLTQLVERTFFFSIFTASIIVFCMLILAFGKIFICYPISVYAMFGLVILCSGFCIYGLIFKILIPSLRKTVFGN
jgi:hypothetical protein